jgi:integrase
LRFDTTFPNRELESITAEEILLFLNQINPAANQTTKRLRYSLLKALYNFCKNTFDETIANPCATTMLKKIFRDTRCVAWIILEKEAIDEIIFKTENHRDRLILELMARGGMRISEVLKLTARDVEDRKLLLHNPKSGKEVEVVYIPQKVADRLKDYIRNNQITPEQRIFPITYSGARAMVRKA